MTEQVWTPRYAGGGTGQSLQPTQKPVKSIETPPTHADEHPQKRRRLKAPMRENAVYILTNSSGQFYVGCSNNVENRLRQHNGELCDGAAATAGAVWNIAGICTGFSDRKQALRFEGRLAHSPNPLQDMHVLVQEPHFIGIRAEEA